MPGNKSFCKISRVPQKSEKKKNIYIYIYIQRNDQFGKQIVTLQIAEKKKERNSKVMVCVQCEPVLVGILDLSNAKLCSQVYSS